MRKKERKKERRTRRREKIENDKVRKEQKERENL